MSSGENYDENKTMQLFNKTEFIDLFKEKYTHLSITATKEAFSDFVNNIVDPLL